MDGDPSSESRHQQSYETMLRVVLLVMTGCMAAAATTLTVATATFGDRPVFALGPAVVTALALTSFGLGWFGKQKPASLLLIYGCHSLISVSMLVFPSFPDFRPAAFVTLSLLAAFLLSSRQTLLVLATALPVYIIGMGRLIMNGELLATSFPTVMATCAHMIIIALLAYYFSSRLTQVVETLSARLDRDETLFARLPSASAKLGSAARRLAATTSEHEEGAQRQSAAVDETRQALRSVTTAAADIANSAANTSRNAETTLENSTKVAHQIEGLTDQVQNISELLDTIGDVANKTDLLSLNASLEGVRAGEAGRGFQLVAMQMQRLAESVTGAVTDIEQLTGEIRLDANSTLSSIQETMKLARITTDDARHIHLTINQLQSAVAQVMQTMDEIIDVTAIVAKDSKHSAHDSADLEELARRLAEIVTEFTADWSGDPSNQVNE